MVDKKLPMRKRITLNNRPEFLGRLAVLLDEGYTFYDGLTLLLPHHMKEYGNLLEEIEEDFRDGLQVTEILRRFGFTPSALLPIAIAENDGRLPSALEGMAIRLEKTEQAKKKLKGLLSYPALLFCFISMLLLGFRKYFLPNMETLAFTRQSTEQGLVSSLPRLVAKIPDFIFGLGICALLAVLIGTILYKKQTPQKKIKFFTSLPVVANLFKMWKTRSFSGEIGGLLQSGLSMQDALDVLINQRLDPVLGEMAKNVKNHVIYGEPFHVAVELTEGMTKMFSSFAQHGTNSGHLAKELIIYSEYLEETINQQLSKGLAILQPILFSIIAICILAAYLALLLPIYGMLDTI